MWIGMRPASPADNDLQKPGLVSPNRSVRDRGAATKGKWLNSGRLDRKAPVYQMAA